MPKRLKFRRVNRGSLVHSVVNYCKVILINLAYFLHFCCWHNYYFAWTIVLYISWHLCGSLKDISVAMCTITVLLVYSVVFCFGVSNLVLDRNYEAYDLLCHWRWAFTINCIDLFVLQTMSQFFAMKQKCEQVCLIWNALPASSQSCVDNVLINLVI